jgi:hypothetical protein
MKKLISIFMIVSVMMLFYNNIANWHYHKLPNGIVVEHAHPFSKPASDPFYPFQKHQHSDIEYLILDIVYSIGLIIVLMYTGLLLFLKLQKITRVLLPVPVFSSNNQALPPLRAPPIKNA